MSYSSSRVDHTVDMLLSMMSLFHLIYLHGELVAWHGMTYICFVGIYFDDDDFQMR